MATFPIISIIIPVYNTEKYIRECLDSILAQTYTDWETILVDDGSPDNRGKICDEYASKDKRISRPECSNSNFHKLLISDINSKNTH